MFRFCGIIFGIIIALYYYAKRYWRKFEKLAHEIKDEPVENLNDKK